MTPPQPEESMVAGDPTQRLLTALGRFQRQVARAEEGAPQESWCDECMNQLIAGIEIALNEDWADVKEALTDAARILQTYEDAGRAEQCVRFLKDSYEILCLMVGDLIVGNVRSGVMKKWQERYERALDELAEAGLTLVDDDGPIERETSQPHGDNGAAADDFDAMLDGGSEDTPDSIFDSEPGAGSGRAFTTGPEDPFAPVDSDVDTDRASDGSPFLSPGAAQGGESAGGDLPSLDELLGRPVSPEDDLDDEEAVESGPDLSDDFTVEQEPPEEETAEAFAGAQSEEAGAAEEDDLAARPDTPHDFATTESDQLDFGETSQVNAPAGEEALDAEEPAPELTLEMEEEPVVPVPESEVHAAAAPVEAEPPPGTPEALLRTAQLAMAAGNVAEAKLFALQLAANMAKLEADQVEGRIAGIEKDIEDNSEAVTAGELAVNEAEERVRKLEEDVARCQGEFEEKQKDIGSLREEVASVEGSVEDLNRQIAELVARRDEEAERLAGCQANLEENEGEERRMQAELDSLHEEESGSRENLDGAREHVRALQQSGSEHAAKLETTQAELERRRNAVENIETTIRHVSDVLDVDAGDTVPPSGGDETGGGGSE